jgi:hypothetical protein
MASLDADFHCRNIQCSTSIKPYLAGHHRARILTSNLSNLMTAASCTCRQHSSIEHARHDPQTPPAPANDYPLSSATPTWPPYYRPTEMRSSSAVNLLLKPKAWLSSPGRDHSSSHQFPGREHKYIIRFCCYSSCYRERHVKRSFYCGDGSGCSMFQGSELEYTGRRHQYMNWRYCERFV